MSYVNPDPRHWKQIVQWNDAMIQQLRELWDEGHSTNEIARRLGTTKNSIVGKAHRLNLLERPSPIIRDGRPPKDGRLHRKRPPVIRSNTLPLLPSENGVEAISLVRKIGDWITPERDEILERWWPTYKPRIEILRIMAEAPGPLWPSPDAVTAYASGTLKLRRPSDIHSANRPPRAASAPKPVAAEPTIRLIQTYARVTGCCFPIGEVGTPTFRFCDVPHQNRSYCAEHEAIAYLRGRRDTGSFAITAETRSSFLFGDMG